MAKLGFKIKFTKTVFDATQRAKLKKEILQAVESSPEYRKEIARVFQMANCRIQNIEKSGQFSPAVQALNKGDITGFTKFSMQGDCVPTPANQHGTRYKAVRAALATYVQFDTRGIQPYDDEPCRQVKQHFGQKFRGTLFDAIQGFHGRNGAKRT